MVKICPVVSLTAHLDKRVNSQTDRALIKKEEGLNGFYSHTHTQTHTRAHTSDVGGETKR